MRELAILLCFPLQQALAHILTTSVSHKEHKVHNIVLYPDKHSWCKTTSIKQVITHPGCKSVEIDNNVCVGGCFSYSIPKTEPQTPGEVLPYCDSCQPSDVKWKHVTLECPDSDYEEDNVMTKRVEMIDSCACASCETPGSKFTLNADATTSDPKLDVPELMSLMLETHHTRVQSRDEGNESTPAASLETERVTIASKNLENTEAFLDLNTFQAMRTKIEREDQKIDELGLSTFVEKMKTDQNVRVDSEKLKSVLNNLEHAHDHSRHHRVPGPHHSMVYSSYSPDIAVELYKESLKTKAVTTELPVVSTTSAEVELPHLLKSAEEVKDQDNLIMSPHEEKLAMRKKIESHVEEKR